MSRLGHLSRAGTSLNNRQRTSFVDAVDSRVAYYTLLANGRLICLVFSLYILQQ